MPRNSIRLNIYHTFNHATPYRFVISLQLVIQYIIQKKKKMINKSECDLFRAVYNYYRPHRRYKRPLSLCVESGHRVH